MALNTRVGRAVLELVTEAGSFHAGLDKAERRTKEMGGTFGKLGPQIAAAFSVTAIATFAQKVGDNAGRILDLSAKVGLTAETIQRMEFVAGQTGDSLEDMTGAAFKLGVALDGGSKSVRAAVSGLGLDFDKIRNSRPDQQWDAVTAALGRVENAGERNRIGVELYGKSFAGIASSVQQGYSDIAEAAVVASTAQLKAIDRFADRFQAAISNTFTEVLAVGGRFLGGLDLITAKVFGSQEDLAKAIARYRDETDKAVPPTKALTIANTEADAAERKRKTALEALVTQGRAWTNTLEEMRLAEMGAQMADNAALARINDYSKGWEDLIVTLREAGRAHEEAFPEPLLGSGRAGQIDVPGQGTRGEIGGGMVSQRVATATKQRWGEMVESMTRTWGTLESAIQGSFAQILLRTRSFGEAMTDIWNSIKGALVNIFADIAAAYLKQLARMAAVKWGMNAATTTATTATAAATAASTAATTATVAGTAGTAGSSLGWMSNPAFWSNPYTIAALGGIALGIAVWKKGLFRGGAEALHVNPRRDKFLAQFGGPGTGEGSGFRKLADRLFKIDPSESAFTALRLADNMDKWRNAQSRVVGMLASTGMRVKSFAMGGFVPPGVTMPAMLHGGSRGELIVPMDRTSAPQAGQTTIYAPMIVQGIMDAGTAAQVHAQHLRRFFKDDVFLDTAGMGAAVRRAVRT